MIFRDEDVGKVAALFTPEVLALLKRPQDKYVRFPLPKKTGGVRWISEPVPLLKEAQRSLLELMQVPQLIGGAGHKVITGFTPGLSIVDNARPHVKKKVVLSMDLKDFFGSLRPGDIPLSVPSMPGSLYNNIIDLCFTNKGLPQGSPVSPMLANWAAIGGDNGLVAMCCDLGLTYTRYADDLTFSANDDIPEAVVQWLVSNSTMLFGKRVKFAPKKIKFMRRHTRQIVTGIVVNEKLSIPRERRMKLRAIKHRIETKGIDSVDNYSFHEIMGELSYLHLTDKQKARDMIDMLLAL